MKVSVLCFSLTGYHTGERLKNALESESAEYDVSLDGKSRYIENSIEASHTEWTGEHFKLSDVIVFIGACGIAVRSIAPFVKSKKTDPAVIVIDECGKYVISLLSGHIGGANEFTLKLADLLGAEPVITTATDLHNTFAVDVFASKNDCAVFPLVNAKLFSAALLAGELVGFYTDFNIDVNGKSGVAVDLPDGLLSCDINGISQTGEHPSIGVAVTVKKDCKPFDKTVYVVPKAVAIGIGCRKDKDADSLFDTAMMTLENSAVFKEALYCIASIDLKKDEVGLISLSEKWDLPFITYTDVELRNVHGEFTSSDFVKKTTGVDNVCERSAVLAAENGILIQKKYKGDGVTTALALRNWRVKFEQ